MQRALTATCLPEGELTTIVVDALSILPDGSRHALAQWLLESGAVERLSVLAADEAAKAYRDAACVQEIHETVRAGSARHKLWKVIEQRIGALDPAEPQAERQANLLASLFAQGLITEQGQVDQVSNTFLQTLDQFLGAKVAAAAQALA